MKFSVAFLLVSACHVHGFVLSPQHTITPRPSSYDLVGCSKRSTSFSCNTRTCASTKLNAATAMAGDACYADDGNLNANYGYGPAITIGKLKINIFGALFGLWEIFWGVVYWYPAMMLYGILRSVSSKMPWDFMNRIDPFRRIPICIAYTWGMLCMPFFGLWPIVDGRENLDLLREVDENGKKGKMKSAMYVANHCSWMDIPFVCRVFGFRNCKMIAKAELMKVPILGRALAVAGHVTLDRTDRKSQIKTYKAGVQWLSDGVNLVTFPEGTRSKNGRLGSFKKGAFKMAQAVGSSIVPMSIHYANTVQPLDYAFPAKPSRTRPKAIIRIGKPIATDGKSDDELLEEVWYSIADDLPESQKPLPDTPVGV